ncbi:MAG: glycoside hydrolase family 130 protein [Planctomycetaceae bacterium]
MPLLQRLAANPLLTPQDVAPTRGDLEVLCTLNPAAVRLGDETLLLVRVGERPIPQPQYVSYLIYDAAAGAIDVKHIATSDPDLTMPDARGYHYRGRMLLSSLSHLRIARSRDGEHFSFDRKPAIFPVNEYEAYGCEDPRITFTNGQYYITYTSVSDRGVTVSLASTSDFVEFYRHGVIFPPYQKDVCIFPRKIQNMYVCRHRPYSSIFNPPCIWTGWSPDLESWGRHELTLAPTPSTWMGQRVGCGAAPIETPEGWLEIFHAADEQGRYYLGAMLSELERPQRIISHSARPVLEPRESYEMAGIYANCVFSNGLTVDEDGRIVVYYGAGDRVCAAATTTIDEMVAAAKDSRI